LKILAFDTSTEYCSLALWLDGKIRCKETLAGQKHSELLLPMLQEMLTQADLALAQLDGIAFGAGPGSFTGLRIACGVAQGLAFAKDIPVAGISTLEAVAQKVEADQVVVAFDARMGEIYHAAYIKESDNWQTVSEPTVCLPQQAPTLSGENWIGCGSGFDKYHKELSDHYNKRLLCIKNGLYPHAREIAQLAVCMFANGLGVDPIDAAPIYIRNKVALKENER
jgi:tRNA threonylcarbamoyladenosine biosynthesis protein TsaB